MDITPQLPQQPIQSEPAQSVQVSTPQSPKNIKPIWIVLMVLVVLVGGYFTYAKYQHVWPFNITPSNTVSSNEAVKLIRSCKVKGVYSVGQNVSIELKDYSRFLAVEIKGIDGNVTNVLFDEADKASKMCGFNILKAID